ncbi:hypothetical protein V8G54_017368 [Vigna mungo]|uniref:Uncharacterized protein n=1 Tax=Vigna mungo TaxID=3915 RepID=A0AAQ3NPM8_VIGMU
MLFLTHNLRLPSIAGSSTQKPKQRNQESQFKYPNCESIFSRNLHLICGAKAFSSHTDQHKPARKPKKQKQKPDQEFLPKLSEVVVKERENPCFPAISKRNIPLKSKNRKIEIDITGCALLPSSKTASPESPPQRHWGSWVSEIRHLLL